MQQNSYECTGGDSIEDPEQTRLTLPLMKTPMLYFEKYEHCNLEQSVSLIRHACYGCVYGTPVIHFLNESVPTEALSKFQHAFTNAKLLQY